MIKLCLPVTMLRLLLSLFQLLHTLFVQLLWSKLNEKFSFHLNYSECFRFFMN